MPTPHLSAGDGHLTPPPPPPMRIEALNAVLDVLGYNIAFLLRNPDEQALRGQARGYHTIETAQNLLANHLLCTLV